MMKKEISGWSVLGRDLRTEQQWISELKTFQRTAGGALGKQVYSVNEQLNPIILIDAKKEGWQAWAKNLNRLGKSVFMVIEETSFLPVAKDLDLVDDVIVYPFRVAELLSKCRLHHLSVQAQVELQALMTEVASTQETLSRTNETLERILTAKTPKRFTGIKGINIMSKHLSGLKPGGDYFDVFESERKDHVNFLLADSSSYGVSSALLGMILSSSAKMANEASMNAGAWINAIHQELQITLGEKEHMSVFFGRLNRRDFSFHYQVYGSIEIYIVEQNGECHHLEKQGSRIHSKSEPITTTERVIHLNPKDRIVILSDGFVNGIGGEFQLQKIFHQKMEKDPFTLVNELAFQIKAKLTPGETFPGEDCSAIVVDVENRVLRLAPTG